MKTRMRVRETTRWMRICLDLSPRYGSLACNFARLTALGRAASETSPAIPRCYAYSGTCTHPSSSNHLIQLFKYSLPLLTVSESPTTTN